MPFDGSGNFSRLYSWQSDRDDGIRILASRMDGEFDNFSAGMNVVFFRNGLVPMTGPMNMGSNRLFGLAAGSLGTPSVTFADDPNSGLYLNGIGRPTISVGNVNRVEANSTGVIITGLLTVNGGLNVSGTITQAGQAVWTAANFTPTDYMPKAGGTFTGGVTFNAGPVIGSALTPANLKIFGQLDTGTISATGNIYSTNIIEGTTPGNGSTGGLRARGSLSTGTAIIQFTNYDASSEYWNMTVAGDRITFSASGVGPIMRIQSNGDILVRGNITANVGGSL